jgi:hypothetical protein
MSKLGLLAVLVAIAAALYFVFKGGANGTGVGSLTISPGTQVGTGSTGQALTFEVPGSTGSSASAIGGLVGALLQGAAQAGSSYENPTATAASLAQGTIASEQPGNIAGQTGSVYGPQTPSNFTIGQAPAISDVSSYESDSLATTALLSEDETAVPQLPANDISNAYDSDEDAYGDVIS